MNLRFPLALLLALAFGTTVLPAAGPLHVDFANTNPLYNNDNVYVTFFVAGGSADLFQASLNGSPIVLTQGSRLNDSNGNPIYDTSHFFISHSYSLTDLANGIDITSTTSGRFYITLGAPLKTGIGDTTPGTGVLTFGEPGLLSGMTDPNWYIRCDAMELTFNGIPADYGDIQTINVYGIPLQVQSFASGGTTPLQTVRTIQTATTPSLLEQLKALADANVANSANYTPANGVPSDWYVVDTTNNNSFLRLVSPATASPGATTGAISYIGPYPSFNSYVDYVRTNNISTPLSDTVNNITFNFNATAATSGADSALVLTGTVSGGGIGAGHTLTMTIPPDTNVGLANANYPLSNAIYGAAYFDNATIQYAVDGSTVTRDVFLSDAGGQVVIDQLFHDLASGYNFGLVGNTTQITNPALNNGQAISLNDMGSAGWRIVTGLVATGQITLDSLHLFSLTGPGGEKLYNQWAGIVYGSSKSVYGFAYSDLFQPVAMFSSAYNSTPVATWTVTVLPDSAAGEQGVEAPVITSSSTATFGIGQPNHFVMTASGSPTPSLSAADLPSWASFNPSTGVLSGTPPSATGAPFTITFTASNGNPPDAVQSFTLNVANLQNFSDWIASYGLSGDTPGDTPQHDGVPNQMKYLCDINPGTAMTPADRLALPNPQQTTATNLTLTFRQYALASRLGVTAQTSPDLQTWTDLPASSITQITTDTNGDPIMQATAPISSSVKFIRLRATLSP